jgi:hypothetical protein
VVFERTGDEIQHFHFLQARPGFPKEWWLTSGDEMHECRIWVSRDDGDTWSDLTVAFADELDIDGQSFPRRIFRLTDLAWEDGEFVWGTDDVLDDAGGGWGSCVFRSPIAPVLKPRFVGRCGWHLRNLVDVGHSYLAMTQGSPAPAASPERDYAEVFLVPKRPPLSGPGLVHLFNVEREAGDKSTFTASRASRAAKDGVFFSHRAVTDEFASHHRILQWEVRFS